MNRKKSYLLAHFHNENSNSMKIMPITISKAIRNGYGSERLSSMCLNVQQLCSDFLHNFSFRGISISESNPIQARKQFQ